MSSTNAFYAGWNQEWFRGIGTTVNYTLSNKGASNYLMNASNPLLGASNVTFPGGAASNAVGVNQALSAVLSIPMKAFGIRENDVLGVGYALVDLYKDRLGDTTVTSSRFKNAVEHTGELYYKYAVNDAISVIPSFQLISHGLGIQQNGFSYVVGLRTSFAF